jgi:hypothetical protein
MPTIVVLDQHYTVHRTLSQDPMCIGLISWRKLGGTFLKETNQRCVGRIEMWCSTSQTRRSSVHETLAQDPMCIGMISLRGVVQSLDVRAGIVWGKCFGLDFGELSTGPSGQCDFECIRLSFREVNIS